uniref:Uncharacterized protein n=1 Tax=Pyramimonas orientalis virus TaxID=455367 RepID=A0A7M3UP13_POV01|nr:hypothetical protein HWQ62_00330 [Pyramimonas orientalis virus]
MVKQQAETDHLLVRRNDEIERLQKIIHCKDIEIASKS